MKISSNGNLNFTANKVLTVQRTLPKNKTELVEVFRLNYDEDLHFLSKCLEKMNLNNSFKMGSFQKKLKSLIYDFIYKPGARSEDYYISIKNCDQISGIMNTLVLKDNNYALNAFTVYPKNFNMDVLFYTFLAESRENYGSKNLSSYVSKDAFMPLGSVIKPDEISDIKRQVRNKFPEADFEYLPDELYGRKKKVTVEEDKFDQHDEVKKKKSHIGFLTIRYETFFSLCVIPP